MALQDIKKVSIREYLGQRGITPQMENEYRGMYCSPYRKDQNASFKVDYLKNVWYDHGTNEGGSIIDLVMKMENCSFHEAATRLEKQYAGIDPDSFSFHRDTILGGTNESAQTILKIQPISHPALIDFVRKRNIDLELANQYCREVHYSLRDKNYFSIGFRNDTGGYELSNPPSFKSCISPKGITTIRNNRDACLVFEGFWDFLSYLTIRKVERSKHDVAVLNSVANVQKAMDFLKTHRDIYTYLDNDEAGRNATRLIQSAHSTVYNRSSQFANYKDLNDYLQDKPMVKQEMKKKSLGIKR
jgi:DNA primase